MLADRVANPDGPRRKPPLGGIFRKLVPPPAKSPGAPTPAISRRNDVLFAALTALTALAAALRGPRLPGRLRWRGRHRRRRDPAPPRRRVGRAGGPTSLDRRRGGNG